MYRSLFVLFTIIIFSFSVKSQVTVKGKVIDATNFQPVEGASVFVTEANIASVTNLKGEFILKGNISETNNITVSSIGYVTQTFTVAEVK